MHQLCTLRFRSQAVLPVWAIAASYASVTLAATERPDVGSAPLRWTACGEQYPGAECAVARVPLDYDEPGQGQTGIQLARIPGASATATLFVNPGGPGGSGVDMVINGFGAYMAEVLGGRFDIVGFDPRGIGSSEPLRCFESSEELADFFADTPWLPYMAEQEHPYFDVVGALSDQCGEQRIREHMSTADVARDLDRLRGLVGDERLSYLGFSYGSYLGNTYANLFPDKVGALVIDGVVGPELWSAGLHALATRVSLQDELDEFLRLCDEAGRNCALSGQGGAGARYDVIDTAILSEPLELGERMLPYDEFVSYVFGEMYTPDYDWGGPAGFGALLGALYDTVLGEPGAGERAAAILAAIDEYRTPPPPFASYDNAFEAYYGNHCSESEFPDLLADISNLGSYAGRNSVLGAYWWWGDVGCVDWPLANDRYSGPWTAETAAPVLIVGNYFDGVTDYAGAVASAGLLPNSRLLSYAGWGHTAFGYSSCITDHVVRYLLDGLLPPEGTVCPANPNPLIPPPAELPLASDGSAQPTTSAARAARAWRSGRWARPAPHALR